jgi:DNA-binding CsgD family transcriptional regulator
MDTTAAAEYTSHLIERPRLLAELDGAEARGVRAICLVAPAGYGKTVLAEQWVRSRHPDAIWHSARDASADVAFLADDLARLMEPRVPSLRTTLRSFLRTATNSEESIREISELLIGPLRAQPSELWLALDDYQFLHQTAAADLVHELLRARAVRLVVATRTRPLFASARAVVYSEVFVAEADKLKFTVDEAADVLEVSNAQSAEVIEATDGWPVVIALSAQKGAQELARSHDELFSFLAEDLFSQLSPETQTSLASVAIQPTMDTESISLVLGGDSSRVLREAAGAGLIRLLAGGECRVHPLVHEFLLARFRELPSALRASLARQAFAAALRRRDWSGALTVAERIDAIDLVARLARVAYAEALASGRRRTVQGWLARLPIRHPLGSLIDAELHLSTGHLARAESLALVAAGSTALRATERHQASCVAGLAAFLACRTLEARSHFECALAFARTPNRRAAALWGMFTAASAARHEDAADLLRAYRESAPASPEMIVRAATGRLTMGQHQTGWTSALPDARVAAALVDEVADPRIRASFSVVFADTLMDAGCVTEAERAISSLRTEAENFSATFATPWVSLLEAKRACLQRRFRHADLLLERARSHALCSRSLEQSCLVIEGFLNLSRGRLSSTAHEASAKIRVGHAGMGKVFLGFVALGAAAGGESGLALELAKEAAAPPIRADAENLSLLASGVVALHETSDEGPLLAAASSCAETDDCLSLIAAYRAYPSALPILWEAPSLRAHLTKALAAGSDSELASGLGLRLPPRSDPPPNNLSKREREVLGLLAEGLTNREISQKLFISEATAKLHVRRILAKTGTRSRTEAALHATG